MYGKFTRYQHKNLIQSINKMHYYCVARVFYLPNLLFYTALVQAKINYKNDNLIKINADCHIS